jgi:DNA polymerase-3 subunit delta'
MLTVLPWHEEQWQQLQLAKTNDRLPHALLLEGPKGIGISHFSQCITHNLLCQSHDTSILSCDSCKACHLLHAGNHPDVRFIVPEEQGKQIKVDQIRKLIEFINLMSQYGQYKIAIIKPADNMNKSTANALLKTLEEPPAQSLIILLSHRPNLLPVTIRSRCQSIRFNPTFDKASINWLQNKINDIEKTNELLKEAQGAPLVALALSENDILDQRNSILNDLKLLQDKQCDPVEIAAKWNKYNAADVLQSLLQIINTMTKVKLKNKTDKMIEKSTFARLQQLANGLDLRKLILCHDLILKNYSLATSNISYNTQGLLEDFIVYWQQLGNQHGE